MQRYGIAVAASLVAFAAATLLRPWAQAGPFVVFLAAVMVSAWRGGTGPGLAVTAVGALALDYVFEDPVYSLEIASETTAIEIGVFLLVAFLISSLNAQARAERQRAEAALNRADEALRARDEVLRAVTHDLKNPLAVISGQAQILERRAATGDAIPAERAAVSLTEIRRSVRRMEDMLDELLDTTRLRTGARLELRRTETDLVELAQAVVDEWRRLREDRVFAFAAADQLVGFWDARRLQRVLDNLLSNGAKYTHEGGRIEVVLRREQAAGVAWATLMVRDDGVGIPAADLPRVFEPFYRGANVAGTTIGTGIGLAGARAVVEQHGGSIVVESRQDAGTAVTVRLPLGAAAAAPVRAQVERPEQAPCSVS